jgi:hypothetical protein
VACVAPRALGSARNAASQGADEAGLANIVPGAAGTRRLARQAIANAGLAITSAAVLRSFIAIEIHGTISAVRASEDASGRIVAAERLITGFERDGLRAGLDGTGGDPRPQALAAVAYQFRRQGGRIRRCALSQPRDARFDSPVHYR